MTKLNVDRMRKRNQAAQVRAVGERGPEVDYPKGSTVIRDAAGQVVRVLPPRQAGPGA